MVKNILLLDSEGKRIAVKYYSDDWPTNAAKEAFEKAVFNKTQKTNARSEGIGFYIKFLLYLLCSPVVEHVWSMLVDIGLSLCITCIQHVYLYRYLLITISRAEYHNSLGFVLLLMQHIFSF